MTAEPRPIYVLRLRPEPGVDAIKALRHALKFFLRQCQLRCLSLEEHDAPQDDHHPHRTIGE